MRLINAMIASNTKAAHWGRLDEKRIVEGAVTPFPAFRFSSLVDCHNSLTIDVDDAFSIDPAPPARPANTGAAVSSRFTLQNQPARPNHTAWQTPHEGTHAPRNLIRVRTAHRKSRSVKPCKQNRTANAFRANPSDAPIVGAMEPDCHVSLLKSIPPSAWSQLKPAGLTQCAPSFRT